MIHPLITDLSGLKETELEAKIQELSQKYWQTPNSSVKMQIVNVLDMYREELSVRRQSAWQKQYESRDKSLDDLIKVN